MHIKLSLLVVALAGLCLAEKVRYDGYKVLRVEVSSVDAADRLRSLPNVDFWTKVRSGGTVDVMVAPADIKNVRDGLEANGLPHFVHIDDVQELIDAEEARESRHRLRQSALKIARQHRMDWESYKTLDEIYEWFDYLEATYPDMIFTETLGQSLEGRDMRVLKICTDGCNDAKPAMYLDAGIHAREWIGPAVLTYIIQQLTEGIAPENQDLIDSLDWYFVPVLNPDGYQYSIDTDRMWRKTRSFYTGNLCVGTDANRNWDVNWDGEGASDNSCSQTYAGPNAFSEIEIVNIRDFLAARPEGQIKYFQDFHSYSQLILHPYGYTTDPIPEFDEVNGAANRGNAALEAVHGTDYEVGCIPCVLYTASGTTVDYGYAVGITYAYTIELRDKGRYGFILPAEQIIPNAEEIWAWQVSVAREIMLEFA